MFFIFREMNWVFLFDSLDPQSKMIELFCFGSKHSILPVLNHPFRLTFQGGSDVPFVQNDQGNWRRTEKEDDFRFEMKRISF